MISEKQALVSALNFISQAICMIESSPVLLSGAPSRRLPSQRHPERTDACVRAPSTVGGLEHSAAFDVEQRKSFFHSV